METLKTKNNIHSIEIQVTGVIDVTESQLRRIIENDDDQLMAEIIRRSFTASGFATLTPGSAEYVNSILHEEYDCEDFEWTI